jgi:Dehydrogenases with different specificities (related to short-chain alcohol dehydrogenases)
MKDPLDFTGKVALVTGSSRGIGAEMIKAFGTRGAQCVVNYVVDAQGQNKADALGVAKELNEPLVIECDVTQPQQVEAMMKQIQDQRGGLDILVNNSGVISDRTIKKMSLDEFESVIRVNLIGTFTVTQKAAAILRNGGRVINMSSVSGQMGCSARRIIRRAKRQLLRSPKFQHASLRGRT